MSTFFPFGMFRARPAETTPLRWRFSMVGALLTCLSFWASAQPAADAPAGDPPGRIASIDVMQGTAHTQGPYDAEAQVADPSLPLTTGDRIWTDAASRLELNTGAASIRLGASTDVDFTQLDDVTAQVRLTQGTLAISVRDVANGERYEIDTPNLALVLTQPGQWRVDVDASQGITRVAARQGTATLYGENAEAQAMAAPERRDFSGRQLAHTQVLRTTASDDFERWTLARDQAIEQSVSARYVSDDMPGIQQLDTYGDWQQDTALGPVWFPRVAQTDWAPYRYGRWDWVQPWGWTWVDDAPWGFAPSHYGRWAQVNTRWAWVPGKVRHRRPTYAPALVGFVGNPGASGSITLAGGRPGVAWFPLAPGEAWRPPYSASAAYVARLNRGRDSTAYQFQSRPGAVTAWREDDFGRRHTSQRPHFQVVAAGVLASARPIGVPFTRPAWADQRGFRQAGWQGGPGVDPGAPLAEQVNQAQWARNQQALEARQQDAIRRQQELLAAQQRFQPGNNGAGLPPQFVRDEDWRRANGYYGRDDRDRRGWRGDDRDNRDWRDNDNDRDRYRGADRGRNDDRANRDQNRDRQNREQQQQQQQWQAQQQQQRERNEQLRNQQDLARRQQESQQRQMRQAEAGRQQMQQNLQQQQRNVPPRQNLDQPSRNGRPMGPLLISPSDPNDRP